MVKPGWGIGSCRQARSTVPRHQPLGDVAAEARHNFQKHVRVGGCEALGECGDQEVAGRRRYCDRYRAGRAGDAVADILPRAVELAQDRLAAFQQGAAGLGQVDAMAVADEQGAAEFLFQHADLPADGGLRDTQKLGAAAVAAEFRHGLEIAQAA